jgi:gliding motility-associated-like protein
MKMRHFFLCSLCLVLCALPKLTKAQVVINEYSAGNKSNHPDNYGEYEDWIELYNAGAANANVGGYHLSDNRQDPIKWTIPAGTVIPAGGRRMFYCSSRDGVFAGYMHTNFKLTQSNYTEEVCFTDAAGVFLDSLSVLPMRRNHSRGRTTDGAATWSVFETPTPNAANANAKLEYMPKVQFSLPAGFYPAAIQVSLSCPAANSTIRYTTNGAVPSAASTLYSGPISVNATTVIRAAAFDNNTQAAMSFPENNTYFINETHTMPVYSVAAGNVTGFFNGNGQETMVSMEYFGTDDSQIFEMDGDINRHGNDSWAYDQRGFRFYVRDDYGYANKIDEQMFPTSPRTDYDVIIIKAAGSDNFDGNGGPSAHIRDAYVQTLSEKFNLNVDVRRYKPALLFVNGQYWGVYESRERIDADFTQYYYNNDEKEVDMLEYWGGLSIRYGSDTAWQNLYSYIMNNSMAVQANFNYVDQRFNVMSLVDYFVLNTYTVNSDWLNWNTAWWRGRDPQHPVKWKYKLWDQDNTFNLGQNYTGLPTTGANADPCDIQSVGQFIGPGVSANEGHVNILNRLMMNPSFEQLYISRYADLMNSAFTCTNMLNHFDSMVARIQPEMQRHCTRWNANYNTWQNNVQFVRNQILGRCNNVDSGLVDCYQLTGPWPVRVDVQPACGGTVTINTITPDEYPFNSNYYGTINVNFKANPAQGWQFDHWDIPGHAESPNSTADSVWMDLGNSGDSVTAVFTPINPAPINLTVIIQNPGNGTLTIEGTNVVSNQTLSIPFGTDVDLNAVANAGYDFTRWQLIHGNIKPIDTANIAHFCLNEPDTLLAIFTQIGAVDTFDLTVIVQAPGNGNVTINSVAIAAPATIQYTSGTLLNLVATPVAGYNFVNWQAANHTILPGNTSANANFSITTDDTLYANFAAIPDSDNIVVIVNPVGTGNVTINANALGAYPANLIYPDGTPLNILATPLAGFTFTNWTLANHAVNPNNTSSNANFNITTDDTLIANFTAIVVPPDSFNLVLSTNPAASGSITVNGTTYTVFPTTLRFEENTTINIVSAANVGFNWANWTLPNHVLNPNNTAQAANFVITQDDNLTANFTVIPPPVYHNLVVDIQPAATGAVNVNGTTFPNYPSTQQYLDGTLLQATATANAGYQFLNWTLINHVPAPNTTTSPVTFTITQPDTLVAVFAALPADSFDIVVDINPHLTGSVNVGGFTPVWYPWTGRFEENINLNFGATSNSGFQFSHYEFKYHTPIPGTNVPIVFINVNQPDTVIAHFVRSEVIPNDTQTVVLIPSGFSPNNDGFNDYFNVKGERLDDYNMQVFNRWGQRVFETSNQGTGWNGQFNGKDCPIGVYSYFLTGRRQNGEDVKERGNITLIR